MAGFFSPIYYYCKQLSRNYDSVHNPGLNHHYNDSFGNLIFDFVFVAVCLVNIKSVLHTNMSCLCHSSMQGGKKSLRFPLSSGFIKPKWVFLKYKRVIKNKGLDPSGSKLAIWPGLALRSGSRFASLLPPSSFCKLLCISNCCIHLINEPGCASS